MSKGRMVDADGAVSQYGDIIRPLDGADGDLWETNAAGFMALRARHLTTGEIGSSSVRIL